MRIFIIGLTSTKLGGMEHHNLGNYAIMEPFICLLKEAFPGAEIVTSIQMSEAFCGKFGITCRREKRFWSYGKTTAVATAVDMLKIAYWSFLKYFFKKNAQGVLKSSLLLEELHRADLVIDFSGDIFGDNANYRKFLEGCAEIFFAKILNKKVAMIIGSPGPFKLFWRRFLARKIFERVDLITNREPVSTELLIELGVRPDVIKTTACPSFMFEPEDSSRMEHIFTEEGILPKKDKPLVGLILSGWNMPEAPFNKLPRKEYELEPFVKLVEHLVKDTGARVLLMSHQNKTDKDGNLGPGNDHAIIGQLAGMMTEFTRKGEVLTLKGFYNAAESKSIIGRLDMVISGRIHGAISALSQCIPTVIIDYGHEPKAHKLEGFARLTGMEDYVCNPRDAGDMIRKTDDAWEKRSQIKERLAGRIEGIKEAAKENFKLLRELV